MVATARRDRKYVASHTLTDPDFDDNKVVCVPLQKNRLLYYNSSVASIGDVDDRLGPITA